MKIDKFADIPQFTRSPRYHVVVDVTYMFDWIENNTKKHKLDLNPDFQRGHVWSRDQKISYIEFCLRGGKTGREILFNCPGWMVDYRGPMVLVDGKQRIEAWRGFLANEFPVFDSYFHEYKDPDLVDQYGLTFMVNDLPNRAEVLKWYIDLNSGGTVHSREEIDRVKLLLENEINAAENNHGISP